MLSEMRHAEFQPLSGRHGLPRHTLEPDIKPGWILGLSDGLLGNGLDTVQVTGHIAHPLARRIDVGALGRLL
jgi:hypothetical protein